MLFKTYCGIDYHYCLNLLNSFCNWLLFNFTWAVSRLYPWQEQVYRQLIMLNIVAQINWSSLFFAEIVALQQATNDHSKLKC
jgi:hypothetical protein